MMASSSSLSIIKESLLATEPVKEVAKFDVSSADAHTERGTCAQVRKYESRLSQTRFSWDDKFVYNPPIQKTYASVAQILHNFYLATCLDSTIQMCAEDEILAYTTAFFTETMLSFYDVKYSLLKSFEKRLFFRYVKTVDDESGNTREEYAEYYYEGDEKSKIIQCLTDLDKILSRVRQLEVEANKHEGALDLDFGKKWQGEMTRLLLGHFYFSCLMTTFFIKNQRNLGVFKNISDADFERQLEQTTRLSSVGEFIDKLATDGQFKQQFGIACVRDFKSPQVAAFLADSSADYEERRKKLENGAICKNITWFDLVTNFCAYLFYYFFYVFYKAPVKFDEVVEKFWDYL